MTLQIQYFRPQRPGPEIRIESAVASQLQILFPTGDLPVWAAGSLPIGAGMPDLVLVAYEPEVIALANTDIASVEILAYLRAVTRAKLSTITERVSSSHNQIVRCLDDLLEAEAIIEGANSFSVSETWRAILPEITTIEAKAKDWRKAVAQAARNRIFAHHSFVALPDSIATRVQSEPLFTQLGVGILSVNSEGEAKIQRRARRIQPRVWTYYYRLASIAASHA